MDTEQKRKLFIGGLSFNTTDDSLKAHFEQWGTVVDCVVMKDRNTKKPKGFGFVTYESPDSVDEAQANRPHVIDTKEVETKRATPREDAGKPEAKMSVKKVFVGGIRDDVDDEQLRDYFSQFGNVQSVDIIINKETQKKRGFAFVSFDDYDPVDKVVLEKNHQLNGKRCDVRKAVDKKDLAKIQPQRGGMGGGAQGGNWNQGGGNNYNNGGNYGNQSGNYGGGNYGNGDNYNSGGNQWSNNQGGGNNWGYNQGGDGGNFNQGNQNQWGNDNYGNQQGNYGNQDSYNNQQGNYGNQQGGYGGGYNNSGNGGPMKGGNFSNRSSGPYGRGYGNQGSNNYGSNQGGGGGGGYGGGNRGGNYNRGGGYNRN